MALACFLAVTGPRASAQGECGAAQDLAVQAREKITLRATRSDIEDGLQLLKHANSLCAEMGDAWYYRSLFEKKLGHLPQADYALRQATTFRSEALEQQSDPFTLSTSPQQIVGHAPPPVREKWALVVGIGAFSDPKVPPLSLTTKDASDFAAFLADPHRGRFRSDHVHLIQDRAATLRGIKQQFNWLARSAGPEDLVVIYLSSHGSPRTMDVAGAHYIATYDTIISGATPEERQDNLYLTALPMEDLASVVRNRIKALRAAVFLDTCHSGAAAGARSADPASQDASASRDTLERIREGVGRVVMASSQVDESSYGSKRLKNGYFTYYLIRGLSQNNGLAPLPQVYGFVRDQVAQQVLAIEGGHQDPVMTTSAEAADFAIGVPAASLNAASLSR